MSSDTGKRPHGWGRPIPPEKRGYGPEHRRIRKALLQREPNCRACAEQGREVKATHADHVIPLCLGGPTIASNYQPLCALHARSKTGREGALIRNMKRRLRAKAAITEKNT